MRMRTFRPGRPLWLALALLAGPHVATAQMGGGSLFVGPGSTAQGDMARGMGVLYMGLGRFNLETAMANSINVDTAIKWNEYVALSWLNWNKARLGRIAIRSQKRKESYDAIQNRIRYEPTARDLSNGDALNALLADLCDPTIGPSILHTGSPEIPVSIVQKTPFSYAPAGGVVGLGRLIPDDDGWPIGLRGPDMASDRKAYGAAIDEALDQIARSQLDLGPIRQAEAALGALREQNHRNYSEADRLSYSESGTHLKRTEAAVRVLRTAVGAEALSEIDRYAGATIADLVDFMHRYNLRFAPAVTPEERELYRSLYQALIEQAATSLGENQAPRGQAQGRVPPVRPNANRN
jgi:hypothetical protein